MNEKGIRFDAYLVAKRKPTGDVKLNDTTLFALNGYERFEKFNKSFNDKDQAIEYTKELKFKMLELIKNKEFEKYEICIDIFSRRWGNRLCSTEFYDKNGNKEEI